MYKPTRVEARYILGLRTLKVTWPGGAVTNYISDGDDRWHSRRGIAVLSRSHDLCQNWWKRHHKKGAS
jgi:hypothetical protein